MLYIILCILLIIIAVIVINTIKFKPHKFTPEGNVKECTDVRKAAENLAEAVKIKTISHSDYNSVEWEQFDKFVSYLEDTYPAVHEKLEHERVNKYSLLYKWNGKDKTRKPGLLLAHMDVVPVEEGTEADWTYPPFGGDIAEGFVWGRGTLDIKIQVVSILEAAEQLLKEGCVPERDIYIAFGHDEEVGGKQGAAITAGLLKSRGLEFEYVIDEGGCVTENALKDIASPVAVVGIAEKGYANIKLVSEGEGGHSSMPPKNTSLGMIGRAVTSLENNQCRLKLTRPVVDMLSFLGPHMSLGKRIIISNLWLFGPLFKSIFSSSASGNALLRTTTAITMAEGSMEPNVLPQRASATVNFRILPGETGESLLKHIKNTINNPEVKIEPLRLEDPSSVSPVDSEGFKMLERTIYKLFPDAVAAPYLVLGGTDSRKFEGVCKNIYRFSPYMVDSSDLKRTHGTNERISIENIKKAVEFYMEIMML